MRRGRRQSHNGRVLVAEDNLLLAEVICDFLTECGLHPVGPATNVTEALRIVGEGAIDGAVLDVKLKEDLCVLVCLALSEKHVPYMFLTGYSDLSRIPLPLRAVPIVCKPFEPAEMRSALCEMLGLEDGFHVAPTVRAMRH